MESTQSSKTVRIHTIESQRYCRSQPWDFQHQVGEFHGRITVESHGNKNGCDSDYDCWIPQQIYQEIT